MIDPSSKGATVLSLGRVSPKIDESAWLAPGSVVVGDVELGPQVSIWYGTILRGDVNSIRVGARSNIQDGCVVHVTANRFSTEIGEDVTVGHRAVVHGCRVGDGALIGIGSLLLDGAVVEPGAWVGAGAVVHGEASTSSCIVLTGWFQLETDFMNLSSILVPDDGR